MNWALRSFGDLLTESAIPAESPSAERRIRVRLNAEGVEKRPLLSETAGATRYFRRNAGQFIYGKQNLHKGAFGVVPDALDGYESSSDLPAFDVAKECYARWIEYFLKQGGYYKSLISIAQGAATKRIQPSALFSVEVPVPPIEVQYEIIEKMDSCSVEHTKLEHEIAHQETLLAKLKQAILQEAIAGKLTVDWRAAHPDVELASQLLHRIQLEKARLVAAKKIRSEKLLPEITVDEMPFSISKSWKWCRLGDVGDATSYPLVDGPFGSSIDTQRDYVTAGVPVLRMMNVKPFRFIPTPLKYVREETYQRFTRHNVLPNDILFAKVGAGIGEACVVTADVSYGMLATTGITRMRVGQVVMSRYLCLFLNLHAEDFKKMARQSSQPFLNMTQIKLVPFPLPPLVEQSAIVERVEALMTHCRALESEIAHTRTHAAQLFQAILKEAFAPV